MIAARPQRRARRHLAQGAGLVVAATVCAVGIASAPAGAMVDQFATRAEAPRALAGSTPAKNQQVYGPQVAAPEGASVAAAALAVAADTPSAVDVPVQEASFTSALPDQRAAVAIRTAMAQIGLPYVWGGDGPTNGDAGFDCSGLTTFSYAAAGVQLPRTAHTQYYAGPHVPAGAPLQPGDLVFYGTPAFVHHVGLYLGDGKMVNAPTFGKPVQVAYYRYAGDDYIGATRPAATGTPSLGELPVAPVPAPVHPPAPETFPAPPAPLPTAVPDPASPQPAEVESAQGALGDQGAGTTGPTSGPATSPPVYGPTVANPEGPTGTTAPGSSSSTGAPPNPGSSAPGAGSPTTQPSATPPATRPTTTTRPSTTNPTTPRPPATTPPVTTTATPPPATTAPPATTTPKPAPPTTTTPKAGGAEGAKASGSASLTTGGTTVALSAVKADANGIPVAAGIHGRAVRLASAGSLTAGSRFTLTTADGKATTYIVASVTTTTAEAAAAAIARGGVVVVVPAAGGLWKVVTTT